MKNKLIFFIRFLIIISLYVSELIFLQENPMLIDYWILAILIILYLVAIIISVFFNDHVRQKIKIISDIIFLIYFLVLNIVGIYIQSSGLGDGIIASVIFVLSYPIMIWFIVWLILDIRSIKK